jgi:hypothetical protein
VVVHDLDTFRTSVGPGEADPPLVVDPDAVLAPSVALQRLQADEGIVQTASSSSKLTAVITDVETS